MSFILLLFILFPANVLAETNRIDCQEIREILVEGVDEGHFLWRDVDAIYKRCLRGNEQR